MSKIKKSDLQDEIDTMQIEIDDLRSRVVSLERDIQHLCAGLGTRRWSHQDPWDAWDD
ncbi:hypothetical protein BJD55_gp070 [Gordonia phage Yvonnetastic]|uniref:Uncharacterized protein n=1 Tax=Gordonia phage Yvonnetastic TaxID=1821566 RepID=A0A142K9B3_9CAUD|nr:hypothetical protein BJD55_gp070 [Gordonia phage Yvonnetastic]AMS02696.1 hypothetical protein SEA_YVONNETASTIC_152 [Gordonia phage Yvonnetastic]